MHHSPAFARIGRRAFLRDSTLILGAAALQTRNLCAAPRQETLRVGLVTDLHYADKPPAGSRHYRDSLDKLAEAAEALAATPLDLLVELGDLIDAAEAAATERRWLKRINQEFALICPERRYVLGNHCVDTLTKAEFLDSVEQARSSESFDRGGWHFVALDACYRSDGMPYGRKNAHWTDANIPAEQIEWLRADLAATDRPTVVFAHQRLDVAGHHAVKNAAEVRRALEESGNARAVFQGHSHQNDYQEIAGIHYCTLAAMVEGAGPESNGYALLELAADGALRLQGFRRQKSYPDWRRPEATVAPVED